MKYEPKQMIVELPNGMQLVVEQNDDPVFAGEIFVGLAKKDDPVWYQELACVRNAYSIDEHSNIVWKDGEYEVLVWNDENKEDCTHKFTIHEHQSAAI